MQSLAPHLVKLSEEMERRRRLSEQDDKPLSPAEVLEEQPAKKVMGVGKSFVAVTKTRIWTRTGLEMDWSIYTSEHLFS